MLSLIPIAPRLNVPPIKFHRAGADVSSRSESIEIVPVAAELVAIAAWSPYRDSYPETTNRCHWRPYRRSRLKATQYRHGVSLAAVPGRYSARRLTSANRAGDVETLARRC